ncbi:MAG: hypothetical protein NZZ41_01250 [Candidatus Dojkabacteria bacterium]|nr:hypothetical protein [Candidatus Dojkabacteria bacterium]
MQKKKTIRKKKPIASKEDYYIDNDEYVKEILNYKKTGIASERLGELFTLHTERYASALSFKNYTFLEEMKSQAKLFLLKYAKSFDPNYDSKTGKKLNAFAYCTAIIYNAFIQVINREKKHSKLKDKIIKVYKDINFYSDKIRSLKNVDLE